MLLWRMVDKRPASYEHADRLPGVVSSVLSVWMWMWRLELCALTVISTIGAITAASPGTPGAGPWQCYTATGQPQYCQPAPFNDVRTLPAFNVTSNSECGVGGFDHYRALGANGIVGNDVCDGAQPRLASNLASNTGGRWQSRSNVSTPVYLSLHLPRAMYVRSLQIDFTFVAPSKMSIQLTPGPGKSDTGVTYARDCAAMPVTTNCIELASSSLNVTLDLANVTLLATSREPSERQLVRDLFFTDRVVIVFEEVGFPDALPATELDDLDLWQYYAVSDVLMSVLCDCSGHASQCSGETSECECQHRTRGEHCSSCQPAYSDATWRRARPGTVTQCQVCSLRSNTSQSHSDCHANATCIPTGNGTESECKCTSGFEGTGVDCADINECQVNSTICGKPDTAVCNNVEGTFLCGCVSDRYEYNITNAECVLQPGTASRPSASASASVTLSST
eukprot:scpid76257/ scgid5666/ Laminin subunit beta-3; Epiligrin subunit bata; Kalinin B1 chain; Kalinin subunit beta; Laminin-5 subunit beta; Nicein subunit beta